MDFSIANEYLQVTATDMGAELQSIKGSDGTEYLWQGDPAYWKRRSPILFPYVARLTGGCYEMDGNRYEMGIHGFASGSRFALIGRNPVRMVWELNSDERTRSAYPRDFSFRVVYALNEKALEITYEVENRDIRPMWFGLGGHPGFRVPLKEGLSFEDYRLTFSSPCHPQRIGFSSDCFLNGKDVLYRLQQNRFIPLKHDLFDDDAIVLKTMVREVSLETDKDPHRVTVRFPQMDYVGFWHRPKTDAPFVCIEPWCSLPSAQDQITVFEKKPDLFRLESGSIYRNCWEIILS